MCPCSIFNVFEQTARALCAGVCGFIVFYRAGENNRVERRVCGVDLASATVCVKGTFP